MSTCRECKYYEGIPKTRRGYCRNEQSYYFELLRHGGNRAADRCFHAKVNDTKEIKPCPFCGGTNIRLSIKRNNYPNWYAAMYCWDCNCYGPRQRLEIKKEEWISRDEFENSSDVKSKAIEAWNRRTENDICIQTSDKV